MSSDGAGPWRILVVDNHDGFRRSLRRALELEGFEILEASGGPEALMLLSTERVDLVVTDLNMPSLSGIDLIHAIRASGPGSQVPIVVLSVAQTEQRVREVMRAGANGYFQKPFDVAAFLDVARPLLESRKER